MKSLGMIPVKNIGKLINKARKSPSYALHALWRRLESYGTYLFGNGRSAPPETISFFLTFLCNLRCEMCGQWGEKGVYKEYGKEQLKQRLDKETIHRILDDAKSYSPTITLFGGEPMMYPGWTEIVKASVERGLRCNMVTNGVYLTKYAEELVEMGMDEIIFSLDGPRELHDKIRGIPGTFDKAMEGLYKLKELKKKTGRTKPAVTVNTTINEDNYEDLGKIFDIAEEIGASHLTLHHLLFLGKESCDRNDKFFRDTFGTPSPDWYGFVHDTLPAIDTEKLLHTMEEVHKRESEMTFNFYPNYTPDEIRRYYGEWEFESDSYSNRCLSPWMVAYIFPDGSVKPYHTMDFTAGNVLHDSFNTIWNNEKYRKFRRVLKARRKFDVCSKGCTELYRY